MEHSCSSMVCLKMYIDSIRNCQTALAQDMVFISWILAIYSTIYHDTIHLLSEKNRVADIYRMIIVVKSRAASLYLSLIISFKVTCCSSCSSLVTSNSVLLFFWPEDHPKFLQWILSWSSLYLRNNVLSPPVLQCISLIHNKICLIDM